MRRVTWGVLQMACKFVSHQSAGYRCLGVSRLDLQLKSSDRCVQSAKHK